MIRKWLSSTLPLFAFVIGATGVLSTNTWAADTWTDEFGTPLTQLSITLGATITPMVGIDEDGEEIGLAFNAVTRVINIDEDGAELDRVAIVAPEKLDLVQGRKYQLMIVNASASTHYFWAPAFDGFAARRTRMTVDKGKIRNREIGAPGEEYFTAEAEIRPGGTAIWEFVPLRAGKYKWGCSIPFHADAGMKGEFVVTPEMTG